MCICHYYSSISMKVEYVVGKAKSALDDGKCVVIGLQNTEIGRASCRERV